MTNELAVMETELKDKRDFMARELADDVDFKSNATSARINDLEGDIIALQRKIEVFKNQHNLNGGGRKTRRKHKSRKY